MKLKNLIILFLLIPFISHAQYFGLNSSNLSTGGGTASATSIALPPGSGYHGDFGTTQAVSFYATTTGHAFTAMYY